MKAEETPTERCRFFIGFTPIFKKTKPRNCKQFDEQSWINFFFVLFTLNDQKAMYLFKYEIDVSFALQWRIGIIELACHNPLRGNDRTKYLDQDIRIQEILFDLELQIIIYSEWQSKRNMFNTNRINFY